MVIKERKKAVAFFGDPRVNGTHTRVLRSEATVKRRLAYESRFLSWSARESVLMFFLVRKAPRLCENALFSDKAFEKCQHALS